MAEKEDLLGKITPKMVLAAIALALLFLIAPLLAIVAIGILFAIKSMDKKSKDKTYAELLEESRAESKQLIEALEKRLETLLRTNTSTTQRQAPAPTQAPTVATGAEQTQLSPEQWQQLNGILALVDAEVDQVLTSRTQGQASDKDVMKVLQIQSEWQTLAQAIQKGENTPEELQFVVDVLAQSTKATPTVATVVEQTLLSPEQSQQLTDILEQVDADVRQTIDLHQKGQATPEQVEEALQNQNEWITLVEGLDNGKITDERLQQLVDRLAQSTQATPTVASAAEQTTGQNANSTVLEERAALLKERNAILDIVLEAKKKEEKITPATIITGMGWDPQSISDEKKAAIDQLVIEIEEQEAVITIVDSAIKKEEKITPETIITGMGWDPESIPDEKKAAIDQLAISAEEQRVILKAQAVPTQQKEKLSQTPASKIKPKERSIEVMAVVNPPDQSEAILDESTAKKALLSSDDDNGSEPTKQDQEITIEAPKPDLRLAFLPTTETTDAVQGGEIEPIFSEAQADLLKPSAPPASQDPSPPTRNLTGKIPSWLAPANASGVKEEEMFAWATEESTTTEKQNRGVSWAEEPYVAEKQNGGVWWEAEPPVAMEKQNYGPTWATEKSTTTEKQNRGVSWEAEPPVAMEKQNYGLPAWATEEPVATENSKEKAPLNTTALPTNDDEPAWVHEDQPVATENSKEKAPLAAAALPTNDDEPAWLHEDQPVVTGKRKSLLSSATAFLVAGNLKQKKEASKQKKSERIIGRIFRGKRINT